MNYLDQTGITRLAENIRAADETVKTACLAQDGERMRYRSSMPEGGYAKNDVVLSGEELYLSLTDNNTETFTEPYWCKLTSAPPEPDTYELIETITLSESVSLISKTAEPEGNAYSFSEMLVQISCPVGPSGISTVVDFMVNGSYLHTPVNGVPNSAYASSGYAEAKNSNGFRSLIGAGGRNGTASDVAQYNGSNLQSAQDQPVTALRIWTTTATVPFPVGTVIRIYGVRK